MDLGPLRALALDLNLQAHGVAIVVTRPAPDDEPIDTRGIWQTPSPESVPIGSSFGRTDRQRIMVLRKSDVPTAPRGTVIIAPEKLGDCDQAWRVDGLEREEADLWAVHLVSSPEDLPG
jgi:hypothetical protein